MKEIKKKKSLCLCLLKNCKRNRIDTDQQGSSQAPFCIHCPIHSHTKSPNPFKSELNDSVFTSLTPFLPVHYSVGPFHHLPLASDVLASCLWFCFIKAQEGGVLKTLLRCVMKMGEFWVWTGGGGKWSWKWSCENEIPHRRFLLILGSTWNWAESHLSTQRFFFTTHWLSCHALSYRMRISQTQNLRSSNMAPNCNCCPLAV